MFSYKLNIRFKKLICHQAGSANASPYLWVAYFKVDGEGVRITKQFALSGEANFKFSPGSHRNLGVTGVADGTMINIPSIVGEWETKFSPMKVPFFESNFPGILGAVCIVLKQGSVSSHAIEEGHQGLNQHIRDSMQTSLDDFDPKKIDIYSMEQSVKEYFLAQIDKMSEGVEDLVFKQVINAQNIFQNIFSLVNRDSIIGYHIWNFTHTDVDRQNGKISFSQRWTGDKVGDWEIIGNLSAQPIVED